MNREADMHIVRHLVAASLSLAGFITTYVLGVRTVVGQVAEDAILSGAYFVYEQPVLSLVSVPNILLTCGLLAVVGYAQGRGRETTAGLATVAVSNLLTQLLKHSILDRPALATVSENTFPSGHMTAFASIALMLIVVAPPRIRVAVSVAAATAVSAVGTLLLRSGWHRLSDVVGAMMLVTLISALAQATTAKWTGERKTHATVVVLSSLSVLGAGVAIVIFTVSPPGAAAATFSPPLLSASIATTSAVLACVAAHLWFLPRHSPTQPTNKDVAVSHLPSSAGRKCR